MEKGKVVVVGAGPVGALAAIYAAQRGHQVEVYELRGDPRHAGTVPLNFTKSINLALSERGIHAMRASGRANLPDSVLAETIPMHGRMIHSKKGDELTEESQLYDIYGRFLRAADRGMLNNTLLVDLESLPNVKLFFNHKLTGADFKKNQAWFEVRDSQSSHSSSSRAPEIQVSFDLLLGCDGAHSAVRHHLMKFTRMTYSQSYIDTLWCEFHITPSPTNNFRIDPNRLHIWPAKEFMFIAIPSQDKSFTCTLFLPASHFATLDADPSSLVSFFDTHFPGVARLLIPESDLAAQYATNPHLPLISIKCAPHHAASAAILGDAAHAMVPFYGQGMNAGLEDVRVLFATLDAHPSIPAALDAYSKLRVPQAHAICDLAMRNYREMRADVQSPAYRLRKWVEEGLSVWLPGLGWATQYSRVSFENVPYDEVVERARRQGRVLGWWLAALGGGVGAAVGYGVLVAVRGGRWRGFLGR